MSDFDLYHYYNIVKDKGIILFFKGAISQVVLEDIGALLKNQITMSKQLKKVFSIFIELAQNIMHYSDEREIVADKDTGVGIITITESETSYKIMSGNVIFNSKKDSIRLSLEKVNNKTAEELKKLYFQTTRFDLRPTGSKGAGLGFIDIARKSKGNISFSFNSINNENSFLIIQALINKKDNL